jgi:hypothetical protein
MRQVYSCRLPCPDFNRHASELMVAGLWLAGIRAQRFGDSFMWPSSWGWAVIWAFSFGLIFRLAAAAGVAIRAGLVQFKSGFRAALPAWITLLACVAGEALHFRGYIGWEHVMKI